MLGEGVLLPNLEMTIASLRYSLIEALLQSFGVTRLIDLVIFRVLFYLSKITISSTSYKAKRLIPATLDFLIEA